jgi:hypothetical protein
MKKIYFVHMISNDTRDLSFSHNQPLKSADDWYTEVLKNRIKPQDVVLVDEFREPRRFDFLI